VVGQDKHRFAWCNFFLGGGEGEGECEEKKGTFPTKKKKKKKKTNEEGDGQDGRDGAGKINGRVGGVDGRC